MIRLPLLAWTLFLLPNLSLAEGIVRVGAKAFTENVILGEMIRQLAINAGDRASIKELGGTQVVWKALLAGQIDVYPEYTGTIAKEILAREDLADEGDIRQALAERGIVMSQPLGFSNSYVLGMNPTIARQFGIKTISDLRSHTRLKFGFSNEFLEREDGWLSLSRHYRLAPSSVRGLEHDLTYRALADDQIQITDFYSTDGKLERYAFVSLEDDREFFPKYEAVLLYRQDLPSRFPKALPAILRLEGKLSEARMIRLNARAELDADRPEAVAADYLESALGIEPRIAREGPWRRLLRNASQHLYLVAFSLSLGILAAVPIGVLAAKRPTLGRWILPAVGLFQTIPSIVLLVVLIRPLGIGERPAIAALFVYSLLPIVRNTHQGLRDIPAGLLESAQAVGLSALSRLRRIELPLAAQSVLAGIKTAAVINVGTATLGGFIGAGGFGQPIFQGLRSDNWNEMVLQGALPTAILSLIVLGIFEIFERRVVPRGLRIKPSRRST
jgi:osmoprotectant transport system permease protein